MTDFRARIGKVKMKGGAEVTILRGGKERGQGFGDVAVRQAHRIASYDEPGDELVMTLVLGIYERGTASIGFRIDRERSPVPMSLMPSWIAEIIRRDIIVDGEAREVFESMFEWQEG